MALPDCRSACRPCLPGLLACSARTPDRLKCCFLSSPLLMPVKAIWPSCCGSETRALPSARAFCCVVSLTPVVCLPACLPPSCRRSLLTWTLADPTADVEGLDVQAKISLLTKLAFGATVSSSSVSGFAAGRHLSEGLVILGKRVCSGEAFYLRVLPICLQYISFVVSASMSCLSLCLPVCMSVYV